jgi:hypothetical protein
LVPYDEGDSDWFFGRDDAREIVLDSLRAYRLTVLYGESGVGKSSLLRASVVAKLRGEAAANITAGHSPELLPVAFAQMSANDTQVELKKALRAAAGSLGLTLAPEAADGTLSELLAACSQQVDGVVFLILDQVEELFLYHDDDSAGRAVQTELVDAIRRREVAASFLFSIREDAVAKLDRLQARIPGLLDNLVRIDHLDDSDARCDRASARALELDHWAWRVDRACSGGAGAHAAAIRQAAGIARWRHRPGAHRRRGLAHRGAVPAARPDPQSGWVASRSEQSCVCGNLHLLWVIWIVDLETGWRLISGR